MLELPITVGVLTGIAEKLFIGLGAATAVTATGIAFGYYNYQPAYDNISNGLCQNYFGENNVELAGENAVTRYFLV